MSKSKIEGLLAQRAKAIESARAMLADANRDGEVISGEAREQLDRYQADAEKYQAEARQLEEQVDIEAGIKADQERAAADKEKVDEARAKANVPETQRADDKSKREESEDDTFLRWLRRESDAYGGLSEIGFKLRANRKLEPVQAYRMKGDDEFRALSIGTDSAGGYTVPTLFARKLYDYRETYATFRQLGPDVLTTSTGASYELPLVAGHGTAGTHATAGTPSRGLPENTNIGGTDPSFGETVMGAFKVGQVVPISNEMIQDNEVDVEGWLAKDIGRALARREDQWFWLGTGTNMPQGVTNGGFTGTTSGTATAIVYEDLTKILGGLDQSYGNLGAHTPQDADDMMVPLMWAMNPNTLVAVWAIKDGDGRYMFQPQLAAGMHDEIMGHKVVTSGHLPVIATGNDVLYFGAWGDAFVLREAGLTSIKYSDDAEFEKDQRIYLGTCRVDLKVRDTRSVKKLTMA